MHKPVLITEIVNLLKAHSTPKLLIDCCYGGGGYSKSFLSAFPSTSVIAFDKDPTTIPIISDRFQLRHESFVNLSKVSGLVDGIVFDLGISSIQLDDPDR